jgi:O-methyltransferase
MVAVRFSESRLKHLIEATGGEGALRGARELRDTGRAAGRRIAAALAGFGQRLAVSLKNRGRGSLLLQYRPDFHIRADRIEQFEDLAKDWTAQGWLPHGGDFVRLYLLYLQVRQVLDARIEGDFAEVGVYRGITAKLLHSLAPQKKLYLFDTFDGFDRLDVAAEARETGRRQSAGQFSDTSLEQVKRFVGSDQNVVYRRGRFPQTALDLPVGTAFSLVHFDADLHEPARAFCEFFYPRMTAGGVMIFHDYNSGFVGVRKAVDGFFGDKPEGVIQIPDKSGTAVVIKNKARPA